MPEDTQTAAALMVEELEALVREFDGPRVHALAIVGSHARGDADAWSDVDLKRFVTEGPDPPNWWGYRSGRLVTVFSGTVDVRYEELRHPRSAIWAVPAFRAMRVLLDRDGKAEVLRQAARAFSWDTLATAADEYVAEGIAYLSEYAMKVAGGLQARDAGRTVAATVELVNELSILVAIHHRLLIPSDRQFIALVEAAAGEASAWTRAHRSALGLEEPPLPAGPTGWETRGMAALHLYRETAAIVRPLLTDERCAFIDQVLAALPDVPR